MKPNERDADLVRLMGKVAAERGVWCESYKESCLRRRIAVRMRARGVHTYAQYAEVLDDDRGEYDRLLEALTINVTKFFRNRETWDVVMRDVVPALWGRGPGHRRVWSAGCASGEEPYTLAIVFLEHARRTGDDSVRISIDATDFDRKSLERAARGTYPQGTLEETPPEVMARYFTPGERWIVAPAVRDLVQFAQHDVLRDPPPSPPYDLIVCRNVVIYFDRPSQDRLFARFIDALRPGGFLILGKVEVLFGEARQRLVLENARERIYRRP